MTIALTMTIDHPETGESQVFHQFTDGSFYWSERKRSVPNEYKEYAQSQYGDIRRQVQAMMVLMEKGGRR